MATAVSPKSVGERLRVSGRLAEELAGYAAIMPWILGFIIFVAGPIIASLYLSLTTYNLLKPPVWVGLFNYETMLTQDRFFWLSLRVTLIYSGITVPLRIAFALLLALLLSQDIPFVSAWRTVYYLPAVLSGVAVAVLWAWVFNSQYGVLNTLLAGIGIRGPRWLGDENWALTALMIMSLWGIGGNMIIYLAGLKGIPTVFYEASEIDGASRWHRFWYVTIPLMTPTLFFTLVTGVIGSLQTFTNAYVMTGGGPNNATLFYVLYLYREAFTSYHMGYACGLAWILFLVILLLTVLIVRSSSAWVFYESSLKGIKRPGR